MIEQVVSRLGYGLIEFEGGSAAEIDPPPKLEVGDTVQIELHGVSRVGVSWMKWIDKDREKHFISYDIDGNPIK